MKPVVFTDVFGWSRESVIEYVDLITTGLRPTIKCCWNLIVQPELPFHRIEIDDFDLNDGVRRKQLADFGAKVQNQQLVIDKNIITSTGTATSLDVAF